MEDLSPDVLHTTLDEFAKSVEDDSHIYEATLANDSEEVAATIAGYAEKNYQSGQNVTAVNLL